MPARASCYDAGGVQTHLTTKSMESRLVIIRNTHRRLLLSRGNGQSFIVGLVTTTDNDVWGRDHTIGCDT